MHEAEQPTAEQTHPSVLMLASPSTSTQKMTHGQHAQMWPRSMLYIYFRPLQCPYLFIFHHNCSDATEIAPHTLSMRCVKAK